MSTMTAPPRISLTSPTSRPSLRRTPLHGTHARLGASLGDVSGWRMPLYYTSELAEHRCARRSAGIFDLSHTGQVRVEGPGAGAALDHALTGLISSLPVGRSRYSLMVSPDGGILDDVVVHHVGDEELLVLLGAGSRQRVAAELARRCAGFDARCTDISLDTALIVVQGPRAQEILCQVVGSGPGVPAALAPSPDQPGAHVPDVLCGKGILARLRCCGTVRVTAAGHSVLLARTRRHGEDGFELFCGWEDAEDLWHTVSAAAAALPANTGSATDLPVLAPCGLDAHDSLRLESGTSPSSREPHEHLTPFDVGLSETVALGKRDFVGRQALLERSRREGAPGTRVPVALTGEGRCPARAGWRVHDADGHDLGLVTSSMVSPALGRPVALALLSPYTAQHPAWPSGTALEVGTGTTALRMKVTTAPFYQPR